MHREARRRHGLPDPGAAAAAGTRPLDDLLTEYLEVVAGGDTWAAHPANVARHCRAAFAGCRWRLWPDVTADGLTVFLGRLRDRPFARPGQRKPAAGRGPLHPQRVRPVPEGVQPVGGGRLNAPDPLRGVKPYAQQRDCRQSRRVSSDAELAALMAAAAPAAAAPWSPRRTGPPCTGSPRTPGCGRPSSRP